MGLGRDRGLARDWPGYWNHNEGPKLEISPGSMFRARDSIGIKIFGIDLSLIDKITCFIALQIT